MHPAGWAIAASLAALMGILAVRDGRGPRVPGWILLPLAALVALNVATAGQALQAARTSALLLAYLMVFLLASRCAGGSDPGERVEGPGGAAGWPLLAIVLAGAGLSVHGLYQSLYSFDRIAADSGLDLSGPVRARLASGRAVSTLGLPAALGGFLAMSLPVTVGAWLAARRRGSRAKWWLAAAIPIQLGGLVATRSAGAVISLAAAASLVMWVRSARAGGERGRRLRRAGGAVVVAGILLAVVFLALRLGAARSEDEGSGPLMLRAGNWKVAVEMMADHPMLGVGAGCYGVAFPAYREWGMNESRFAHNSYLQMFAETGGLLGLTFLILMGMIVARLLREPGGPLADWRAMAGLAFLTHNLVDFTFFLPTLGFTFFWLAGISGASPRTVRSGTRGAVWTVAPLSLLLAFFALGVYRSDSALMQARSLVEAGLPDAASDAARRSVRANPFDPDSRSFLSRLLLDEARRKDDAGLMDESEFNARAATSLDPWTPHHWHHLGQVLLARSDPVGAYIAVARAARLYPIRIEYREERDLLGQGIEQRRPRP